MIGSAAACARGRARASWARKQGEANTRCGIGEPDDADPATLLRVIRVRGVVGSVIYQTGVPCSCASMRWSAASRASSGGWVENSVASDLFAPGGTM